jgi:hypothetical protein
MKKPKAKIMEAHVSKTNKPMGDYYGTGVKQKVGRMLSPTPGINPVSKKGLMKPPKALA